MNKNDASAEAPPAKGVPVLEASVIIPAYQVEHLISECLDAIGPQLVAGRHELIVVDDASTDGTAAEVRRWSAAHPGVPLSLLVAPKRGGANSSRNAGALHASGRLLAFTDGDDLVLEGWVDSMVQASAHSAFLAGAVHDLHTNAPITYEFRFTSIKYAHGNSMAVAKKLLVELEGFDPRILGGGTEVEFAARMKQQFAITPTEVPGAITLYRQPTTSTGTLLRIYRRQYGHVLIGRLHPDLVPADSSYRSIRTALRIITTEVCQLLCRRAPSRDLCSQKIVRAASLIVGILRLRLITPGDRRTFSESLDGYRVEIDNR